MEIRAFLIDVRISLDCVAKHLLKRISKRDSLIPVLFTGELFDDGSAGKGSKAIFL
jgi:hypothetical protein